METNHPTARIESYEREECFQHLKKLERAEQDLIESGLSLEELEKFTVNDLVLLPLVKTRKKMLGAKRLYSNL